MQSLTADQWAKQLFNWSGMPDTLGEAKLLAWVLGDAIATEPRRALSEHRIPFAGGSKEDFFPGGFEAYCGALNLSADFVREQIARAFNYVANATLDAANNGPDLEIRHA